VLEELKFGVGYHSWKDHECHEKDSCEGHEKGPGYHEGSSHHDKEGLKLGDLGALSLNDDPRTLFLGGRGLG
jgi:hypothetical protein